MKPPVEFDAYVIDPLMRDLVGHDRCPSAYLVYLCLWARRKDGAAGAGARISHQALADATGLSRSGVQAALELLQRRGLVVTERATPTSVPRHTVQRPWASRGVKARQS